MNSPYDGIRELCWNIPGELVIKLIFGRINENDMRQIIKAEKKASETYSTVRN